MLQNNPNNHQIFIGVDECGRGCLAGPVVAAAVVWNPLMQDEECAFIRDSKKLSKSQRDRMADFIKDNAVDYAIAFIDNNEIDKTNILKATYKAMHEAINKITIDFDHILVDGNSFSAYKDKPYTCVIRGDDTYLTIAAASILAKTERDSYMAQLHTMYPVYNWKKNVGYGTAEHLSALQQYGVSEFHRKSFSPCIR